MEDSSYLYRKQLEAEERERLRDMNRVVLNRMSHVPPPYEIAKYGGLYMWCNLHDIFANLPKSEVSQVRAEIVSVQELESRYYLDVAFVSEVYRIKESLKMKLPFHKVNVVRHAHQGWIIEVFPARLPDTSDMSVLERFTKITFAGPSPECDLKLKRKTSGSLWLTSNVRDTPEWVRAAMPVPGERASARHLTHEHLEKFEVDHPDD
jgi:hypothetical protein